MTDGGTGVKGAGNGLAGITVAGGQAKDTRRRGCPGGKRVAGGRPRFGG